MTNATGPPIVLDGVGKSYVTPPDYIVHDFSLTIEVGEFFCLVGPSGCGKSTVLKMMAGITPPSSGVLHKPDHVGMVFQSYALLPWLTVEDNVAFAAQMRGFDRQKVREITERYLNMVHLEGFSDKYPRELSGGQRQRVGIARALAVESDVLIMDEPFSALDPLITDELHDDLLDIWAQTHKTIVMVSHHFDEAVILADRIGVMNEGTLDVLLPVLLPRPRDETQPAFMQMVSQVRAALARPARSV